PMAALAQRLQRAARPAIALAQQLERALRRLGENDGTRLVDHVPARAEQLHRQIEILGVAVAVVAAHRLERALAEGAERPGHDGDDAGRALRALGEAVTRDVLERLPRRPGRAAVGDAHVARDRADPAVGAARDAV